MADEVWSLDGRHRCAACASEIDALRREVEDLRDLQRVRLHGPNATAVERGLVVGATVRAPNGDLGVVAAYDAAGDPVLQGADDEFPVYLADEVELVIPPRGTR